MLLLLLLLGEPLLAACSGGSTLRRTREDAGLLSIAGSYRLTGELPPTATRASPRLARIGLVPAVAQGAETPSEVWNLFEYYAKLREQYEREARAQGLSEDVIQKGLADIDARMKALADKANALQDRRSRHGRTVWKRFFDGLGRFMGRAFDIGGKIVKFALEDVPAGVGEYGPEVIKALAQEYVRKLRGELREKGEQKAFEILAEKSPNLAGAYLLFKAGREGVKALRDFARLFGRHRRGGQAGQNHPAAEGGFELPSSGMLVASCNTDWYHRWGADPSRTIVEESFDLWLDYEARTFEVSFHGQDRVVGEQDTSWIIDDFSGSGTVSADGFLHGKGSWDRQFSSGSTVSLPLEWRGILRDDLRRADIEFCRTEEVAPSLESLRSQGRPAFPGGFGCEYIFACTQD